MNLYRLLNSMGLLLCAATVWAQPFAEQVTVPVTETLEVRQQAQQQADAWHEEREALQRELDRLSTEAAQLETQCRQFEDQIEHRQQRVASLQRDLAESGRLTEEMVPFLTAVVQQLTEQVNGDLPFLTLERQQRLSRLEETLEDDDLSIGEKFRRILEAVQVETAYGRRFDVVQKNITLAAQTTLMNQLQLGRLALFAQSLDGQRSAVYDPVSGQWQPLDDTFNGDLRKAIEMAGKHRPVDLLSLPIGKVVTQ